MGNRIVLFSAIIFLLLGIVRQERIQDVKSQKQVPVHNECYKKHPPSDENLIISNSGQTAMIIKVTVIE